MLYGVKYGGVIRLSRSRAKLVHAMELQEGPYTVCGERMPGSWNLAIEPVNRGLLPILAESYEIVNIDEEA